MKQLGLRSALLATSSALALILAGGGAHAACVVNPATPFTNNGTIDCVTFQDGLNHVGSVTNSSTGLITPPGNPGLVGVNTGISVFVAGTTITGDIINNGTITSANTGFINGIGVSAGLFPGALVTGSVTNNNQITVTGVGIYIGGSVGGDVVNNQNINSGRSAIQVTGTNAFLTPVTIGGSVINNGTITFTGDNFHNGISVIASLGNVTVKGDVSNTGSITIVGQTGVVVGGVTVGGTVSNRGTITATGKSANPGVFSVGMGVFGSTVNAVQNSGTITADVTGIWLGGTSSVTTDVTNTKSGKIQVASGVGILVSNVSPTGLTPGSTTISGKVVNQGTITAKTGIQVIGSTIKGGITNTGNITGTRAAIDLSGAGTATTFTQAGGKITGDILLSAFGDTVNVTGGAISGNIVGQAATGTVNFALGAGNIFTYSNTITGVNAVNVSSGTLYQNNFITATTVNVNGGTLAPGLPNQVGTLNINGKLAFTPAGSYLVTVTPATASFTSVSGTASLAGTVQAVFQPGTYVPHSYDILHAASLNGTTFSNVTSTSSNPNFGVSLSYTPTDVFLNLTGQLGFGAGLSQNQQNVANAINTFFNKGGTLPPAFANLFNLTDGNLANALSLSSGEAATGAQQGAFQLMTEFLGLMLDPFVDGNPTTTGPVAFAPTRAAIPEDIALAYASVLKAPAKFEQRWTAWGSAYGGYNRTDGDPAVVGSHDLTARTGGVAAGADYRVAPGTVLGFALAGGFTNWGLAQGLGGGHSDALQAGVYGTTHAGPAYLAASLAFADHWMATDRFAAAGDHLTASFNAQSYGARLEGGYRFAAPFGAVTPYAALQAQDFHTPNYVETGTIPGGFGLGFNARDATDTRSELGARFDKQFLLDSGALLSLRGRLAWAHDWVSDPSLTAVFQSLPGASFIVNGAVPARDSALASSLAELRLANGVSLMGKIEGEFASHSSTYAGTATVRVSW